MNCAKDNVISSYFTWSRWKEDGKMSCHTWKQPGLFLYDTHFSLHCWLPFCVVRLSCVSSSLDIYTWVISCFQLSTSIFWLIGYHFTSANSKGAPRWFCNVLGLQCKRYWLFNNFVKEKSKLKILRKFERALGILECDFINFRPKVVGDIEFEKN